MGGTTASSTSSSSQVPNNFATNKYQEDETGYCYLKLPLHMWYDEEFLMYADSLGGLSEGCPETTTTAVDEFESARQLLNWFDTELSQSGCMRWLFPLHKLTDACSTEMTPN